MVKICALMFFDDAIKNYASINYKINKLYCDKLDITLVAEHNSVYEDRPKSYEKIPLLLRHIKDYDYVMWIDADAFFYKNAPNILDLIEKNKDYDFIFSDDIGDNNINCGFFIVKNTEYSINFLNFWAYDQKYYLMNKDSLWWEQSVLISIYNDNVQNIQQKCIRLKYGILQHFGFEVNEIQLLNINPYILHYAGRNSEERFKVSENYYNKYNYIIMSEHIEIDRNNKYTIMQQNAYELDACIWSISNLDPVVGSFNAHNGWKDYDDYLFKDIPEIENKTMLDFGCGPGRNMVKYSSKFRKIDGVDISNKNLENAILWIKHNNINLEKHDVILCNGVNLDLIDNEKYDIVMSTICMQHICVYDIRLNYLKEFYRILKNEGYITIQMGYGVPLRYDDSFPYKKVDYYANNYDAFGTNGYCDASITNYTQIEKDLINIGFRNFKYYIRPTGPGDSHPNWIFFNAQKII